MIFIFGVSPREKVIGPCEEITCSHCNNRKFWLLKETQTFISFFFIPIIPISKKRFMQCPICSKTRELNKEEFERQKQDAQHNNIILESD